MVSADHIVRTLLVQSLPMQTALTVLFCVSGTPDKEFAYRLDLITPDGQRVSASTGRREHRFGRHGIAHVSYEVPALAIETVGIYRVEIFVDDAVEPSFIVPLLAAIDPVAGLPVSRRTH